MDVHYVCGRVRTSQEVVDRLDLYSENGSYQFPNIYVDDFNFGERCKFEVVRDRVAVLGTMGLRLEFSPRDVHI